MTTFASHITKGTHAARPAATAVPSGSIYSCSDHSLIYQSDGATWATYATLGASSITYTTYTPTLTAATTNPTLGTGGTATGRYFQSGKYTVGDIVVQFGTSGASAGSGTYYVSFPVAANTAGLTYRIVGTAYGATGGGVNLFTASAAINNGTRMQLVVNSTSTLISHNTPATWTNNDVLIIHFAYEAA